MIKTNSPEYNSLQNIIKFYAKALMDSTAQDIIGNKTIIVDISDSRTAANTYREFKLLGDKMQPALAKIFRKYVEPYGLKEDELDQYRLTNVNKFVEFFKNPYTISLITNYLEQYHKDYTLKVKFEKGASPKFSEIIKANDYFKKTRKTITWVNPDLVGLEELKESLENPDDINNYWVCRTMHGNAPAMMVECSAFNSDGTPNWSNTKESNSIEALYAAYTNTKYIDARACSYEYWNENEDVRFSTAE